MAGRNTTVRRAFLELHESPAFVSFENPTLMEERHA